MISRIITSVFVLFLFGSLYGQSGWLKPKGSGYAQLSAAFLSSDNYYNTDGNQLTTNEYQSYALTAYAEYGVTDRFNLLLNGPLLRRQSFSSTEATYGVGDVRVGGKYALLSGAWPVSLALEADIPLSPQNQFARNKEQLTPGIIDQINLPASDGEFNFWGTLAASRSLSDRSFVSAFGAFNVRTKGLSHQVKAGVEAGYRFFDKLYVMGQLSALRSLGEPKEGLSFVRGEGVAYTAAGITLFYEIDEHFNLLVSGTTYNDLVFSRKNIYSGAALNLGVAYQW
ncbi:hypothetical protein FUA23_17795 [Neolewinella aurantiaca]|uniref:Uncharacterized protein n=1 Tax=Neolewinella aurantiaca TaxID=2602767 RepID=A0A5C7FMP9_9BACT|nr:hypothetical protein [Neolewinella aurantiaca]TXF87664.1 hypothetical protein FUA23_17795 [Neolewinella aurantiaca]